MISKIVGILRNRIGWSTNRHIIVFESDDWGSIRTRSLKDREDMEADGLNLHFSIFPRFDCLESNDDLERLFELLSKYKDSTGRPPVFTPMCIVANPAFEEIEKTSFAEYRYETVAETHKRYPGHDRVLDLWREGISKRLFVPGLHGREHLNVNRWMKLLQNPKNPFFSSFRHQSIGVSRLLNGMIYGDYLGAFYSQDPSEFESLYRIANDACRIFEEICGYSPTHFISPNEQPVRNVQKSMVESGVEFITNYKNARYPKGNGSFEREINWIGKHNRNFGYTNICRNGVFDQVDVTHNYIAECLHDIEQAFRYRKPCVISTHRVNYVGGIEEDNASDGLKKLDVLLREIMKRWPDVEFMTSTELGTLMMERKK